MPIGKVSAHLVGGPLDGQVIELPNFLAKEKLALADPVYFAQKSDGKVAIKKGYPKDDTAWMAFTENVYVKELRERDQTLYYNFDRSVVVNRCTQFLIDKSRRCKNDALEETEFCRQHAPPAQQS